jgi:DNA invertase Pin-like site-specific DNA recombinase
MTFVRRGDTVVMHSMDRLARNLDDLRRVVPSLTTRGVRVPFLSQSMEMTFWLPGSEAVLAQVEGR